MEALTDPIVLIGLSTWYGLGLAVTTLYLVASAVHNISRNRQAMHGFSLCTCMDIATIITYGPVAALYGAGPLLRSIKYSLRRLAVVTRGEP